MDEREYSNMKEIPIDKIVPNPDQPRKRFNQATLEELAGSIREYGVIEPIIVKPVSQNGSYMLVVGERRWRAAKIAGKTAIPAIVRNIDAQKSEMIALVENLQREDLALSDEIPRICELVEFCKGNIRKAAETVNKSITYINDRLTIKNMPGEVRDLLDGGQLTISQAKIISEIPDKQTQMNAARLAVRLELDANQLRARIQRDIPQNNTEAPADKMAVKSKITIDTSRYHHNNSGAITAGNVVSALINAYDALERYDFNLAGEEKKQILRKQIGAFQKMLDQASRHLNMEKLISARYQASDKIYNSVTEAADRFSEALDRHEAEIINTGKEDLFAIKKGLDNTYNRIVRIFGVINAKMEDES